MVIETGISTLQLQETRAKIAEFHKKHVDQVEKGTDFKTSKTSSANKNIPSKTANLNGSVSPSTQGSLLTSETITTKVPLKGMAPSEEKDVITIPNHYNSINNFSTAQTWSNQTLLRHESFAPFQQTPPASLPRRKGHGSLNPNTNSTPVIYYQAANSNSAPQKLTSTPDKKLSDSFGSGTNPNWADTSSGYASDNMTEEDRSSIQSDSLSRSSSVMDQSLSGRRTWTTPGAGKGEGKGILSHKGTIRGVTNKVRTALIAFNYEPDIETKAKIRSDFGKNGSIVFPEEEGRVVLYTTSSGIIPEVGNRCSAVRKILMNHRVKFEERDLFLSKENVSELEMRLKACGGSSAGGNVFGNTSGNQPEVPQVFIDGVLLGNAKKIEELNESGELKKTLRKFEKISSDGSVCGQCWGYTYILCAQCNGSKKSGKVRNGFTDMFIGLKCTHCDMNGLQKCPAQCYKK